MQKMRELLILRAAYDLSRDRHSTMQGIAKAAARAIPRGPIAVGALGTSTQLDPEAVCFERADPAYISRFRELGASIKAAAHELLGSVDPGVIVEPADPGCQSPRLQSLASGLVRLCLVANTGDGGGIFIVAGEASVPHASALQDLQGLTSHLASAWRIRNALPAGEASSTTARDVLRRMVCQHDDLMGDAQRSSGGRILWPALLDGSWSLLDTFTADWTRTRHVVACQNPSNAPLRALSSQERAILDIALAGRAGKWIAGELDVSESNVSRALRSALTKLGGAGTSDLQGIQTARFELLLGVNAGVTLGVSRLPPHGPLPATLSDAERAIVASIVDGKYVVAIARERGTSPRTVMNQIASIYRKLGASSRREVVALLR
jgi:DNA-binding NarL/FixJ family response regulator